ncbi:glycoside hydrolase domain-containing protein, partial [Staphylococcus agnetis]|uniref:glycoside hydrolase domain-containing protein n=1 Tax=Staphylococcus agnetis TaxID=985762 RepID=UPI0039ECC26B
GFYPAEPFSGAYVLGQPMLARAELRLPGGPVVQISGRGATPSWRGRPLLDRQLRHADLVQGGDLVFR